MLFSDTPASPFRIQFNFTDYFPPFFFVIQIQTFAEVN